MRPYELTRDAEADLEEITRYTIKEWGEVQAESYLAKIKPISQKTRSSPGHSRKNSPRLTSSVVNAI